MATERLAMRKIREVLRLRWDQKRSVRETSESLGVSTGVVSKIEARARGAGLDLEKVGALDDPALERLLYGEPAAPGELRPEPDPVWMHQELRRKGVTLELLHLEYITEHPNGLQYTAFCDRYRRWLKRLGLTMRHLHKAGVRTFLDFSGKRPHIVDRSTGERVEVELFVAVLGASSFTYAEAVPDQSLPSWIHANVHAFEYFGGVTEIQVPDQLKSAVWRAHRVEPGINRTYLELARHYGTTVVPARPRKPRDKAKVEVGVQVVQRWILARLRHETFFTIEALNARIWSLLDELNRRPRKHLGGVSRQELYERVERPALKALPAQAFEYGDWKSCRVNLDYHLEIDRHWYSVPFGLVGEVVEARFTATSVEVFLLGRRVASHLRSYVAYAHTTDPGHRPPNHRAWAERDVGGLVEWADSVGPCTAALMKRILESNHYRDQTWRSGRALKRIGEKYGAERTEAACARGLAFGASSYKPIERMLKLGLEQRPDPDGEVVSSSIEHDQVRGPDYYLN